jgi:heavy metal sensor kinase
MNWVFHKTRVFSTIRFRLTLLYVALFAVGLTVFSLYLFFNLRSTIYRQFDDSLLRTAQAAAGYFTEFTERGNAAKGAAETVKDVHMGRAAIAILQDDHVLAANDKRDWRSISVESTFAFQTDSRTKERIVAVPVTVEGIRYRIIASEPLADVYHQMEGIEKSLVVGLPLVVLLAVVGGVILSERGLRPVGTICEQAEKITASNLDARLPVLHPNDEVGRLSRAFNALLGRLESSFRVMRLFMADASHELKTPLSVMQGEIDVVLSRERSVADYRESLGILRDQARRMSRIVNDLLALSRADAGQSKLLVEELYLNDLVAESVRAAKGLAARKNIELTTRMGEADICIVGNEELLQRMIFNLLDNAIQYTPPNGSVRVELVASQEIVRLSVADTGIGIPGEHFERVFDRYFRVDSSRNRASGGGAGLGLSIVKLAVDSHKGSVRLQSVPGEGSTFTVELPSA